MSFILRISVLLALTSIFASSSHAAIKIISYSDHYFQIKDATEQKATIYVGKAGTACSSDTVTCDTCNNLDLTTVPGTASCNAKSINPSLKFYVTVSSDLKETFDNSPAIRFFNGTAPITMTEQPALTATSMNTPITAAATWGQICGAFSTGNDSTCETAFSGTLKVGIDENNSGNPTESVNITINYKPVVAADFVTTTGYHTMCDIPTESPKAYEGVCGFTILPGDQKVFISDIIVPSVASNWPTSNDANVPYWGARFFYAPSVNQTAPAYTDVTPGVGETGSADIQISADRSMSPTKITGLTNDVKYTFIVGTLDYSGNVRHFTNVATTPFIATHAATPSEVFGMLDKQKCFIATAAYGSEMDSRIDIFRNFRDQILMSKSWGRSFVNWYYKNGPKYAKIIAQSDELRFVTRGALWPLLSFAQLSLTFGFLVASVISALVLGGVVFGIKKLRKVLN